MWECYGSNLWKTLDQASDYLDFYCGSVYEFAVWSRKILQVLRSLTWGLFEKAMLNILSCTDCVVSYLDLQVISFCLGKPFCKAWWKLLSPVFLLHCQVQLFSDMDASWSSNFTSLPSWKWFFFKNKSIIFLNASFIIR